jgi:uncharacterized NAD-dependent epimerase/dehydratase family protein
MTDDTRRVVVLAHGKFPDRAKTATGVMKYGTDETVAVLDRDRAGERVADCRADLPDAPIVGSMAAAPDADALLIGIAPIGGGFDESWREDVETAIDRGCDVIAGLHYFLSEDDEFVRRAETAGVELRDVRKPDPDIGVAQGIADEVDAKTVLTVGTDCSVGKMTASLEIVETARERGIDAAMVPTGQTGIMIEGWGNPVDRVVSDFTAGAVEEMLLEIGDDHDLLVVEGQGSITHPAYSAVTCGILHGAMADALVLCHVAGREAIHGYVDFPIPPIPAYVALYESLADPVRGAEVVAGCLNTADLPDDETAGAALADYAEQIGGPATDPVRFDAGEVVDAVWP